MITMVTASQTKSNKSEGRGQDLQRESSQDDRLISIKTTMFILGIKSLNTLKTYELRGLLSIYRFNGRNWKCRLSDVLAVPDRIKAQQQAPIDNLQFLEGLGIRFSDN